MRNLLITDIPAPWRERVYELVHQQLGDEFHVVYCKHNERRRLWTFRHGTHPKTFLRSFTVSIRGRERFCNFGIIPFLLKSRPRVVICFSLNPTIFLAFLVCKILRCRIVVFADTWLGRDRRLSWPQRLARRIVYSSVADAFLGASRKTLEMYQWYNPKASAAALFQSALCADNDHFLKQLPDGTGDRPYDLMFSGRIVKGKNPLFLAEVAACVRHRLGVCRVLIIGEGDDSLKRSMLQSFKDHGVECHFPGFVAHADLPRYYSQAKLLLLPTSEDCWGVVINEAMISGTPVITTAMTAAAGELVLDGHNGFVLPLAAALWADRICSLLESPERLALFRSRAREAVAAYSFENAAQGILDAIAYVSGPAPEQAVSATPSAVVHAPPTRPTIPHPLTKPPERSPTSGCH